MTIESNRQDIVPIQMLRGIAALMVVFVHLDLQLARLGYATLGSGWLATGVDIFFVISGFIMWVSVARRPSMSAGAFFRNRLIRIVPLYWLISAGVLVMTIVMPQLLHTTVFNAPHVLASFFFLPARHPLVGKFWPLLIPGWTLNYEMLFYLMFAAAIAGSGGSPRRRFWAVASMITSVVLIATALKNRIDVMHFYANPMMFEFLAGILIGILYVQRRVRSSLLWIGSIALGFFLLWFGQRFASFVPLTNLVAASLIVAGALFSPPMRIPGLKALGDASYSLYLTHVVTFAALAHIWRLGFQNLGPITFGVCSVTACVIGALLCYRLIELPLTENFRKWWRPQIQRSAAV